MNLNFKVFGIFTFKTRMPISLLVLLFFHYKVETLCLIAIYGFSETLIYFLFKSMFYSFTDFLSRR